MANLGTAKECRKKTFKFLIARQMCYITNKIEYNGCGKIISELNKKWMFGNLETLKQCPNERHSHIHTHTNEQWLMEKMGGYRMVLSDWVNMCELHACIYMMIWRWRHRQTNKHHPHSNLLHKINEREKLRLRNHNS